MALNPTALALRAKIIGALIRDARLSQGKEIETCAQAIGVSAQAFQAYELGEQAPSLPELEAIAYSLNVPLDHFWESQAITASSSEKDKTKDIERLIQLRQRMTGALVRQARLEAGITLEAIARHTEIDQALLEAYELGEEPIPLPLLEVFSGLLSRSIREFFDRHGPVGRWTAQQRAMRDFLEMPVELQEFISKPVNRPYVELAVRLSEMSVDRLRSVAEGLLEITY